MPNIDHEARAKEVWEQLNLQCGDYLDLDDLATLAAYGRAVERAVWAQATTELKRRAEFYTATRDAHTQTRDIQFNEAMGCVETLEKCRAQGG